MSKPTCPRCGNAKHRGRCKSTTVATEQASPAVADDPAEPRRLTIEPGLGVEAWIENGLLQIAQDGSVLALSKTEAKVLFAEFGEWAA